ncbi:MAG: hypothetical protein AAFV93_17970 [Chloroflexota bacterium]
MSNTMQYLKQVGSNVADDHPVIENEDGTADVVMTSAQANKLSNLLGEDYVGFVSFVGRYVCVRIDIEVLATAAANNKRTSRGSSVPVDILSKIVYGIHHAENVNIITEAWWSKDDMSGGITVNGTEYEILAGLAQDYYDEPEDPDKAKEWNPERLVYVVELPTEDGELVLTSYGVTNLIRRVVARNEAIS